MLARAERVDRDGLKAPVDAAPVVPAVRVADPVAPRCSGPGISWPAAS